MHADPNNMLRVLKNSLRVFMSLQPEKSSVLVFINPSQSNHFIVDRTGLLTTFIANFLC